MDERSSDGGGARRGPRRGRVDAHRGRGVVTVAHVRALAMTLPRTTEHLIRDRVKFRVKQIVYCAFSRDETLMGFGYPKLERDALVAAEPDVYLLPGTSDLRFNWIVARLDRLDLPTMEERVIDAWTLCVPKFLVRERLGPPP